ncbi:hypothetical protein ACM92Y_004318 [Cronobacter malonaticus]|nr:hypothetical protein [Cronobacter sakazakii]MDT3584887.1 hypothetical protein [Cronobacter sakazakii]
MQIIIRVTEAELAELNVTAEELKDNVISDLDDAREYPGFNVEIEIE